MNLKLRLNSDYIIHVPFNCKVFLLEDSEERVKWFRSRVRDLYWVATAEEGLACLETMGPFDWYFLDHDLGVMDAYGSAPQGSGLDVAIKLASTGCLGKHVVIHSWNADAAGRMKSYLPFASVIPFGNFEIKEV